MYHELKYLYSIPVFIACLLSACDSADMPAGEAADTGAELSFATYDPHTRAETPAFDKFYVYGDKKYPIDNTAHLILFNNTVVEYNDGSWTYDGVQYWYKDQEHSFVAIAPASVAEATSPQYSDSQLSFTYTLPFEDVMTTGRLAGYKQATDILAATHRRSYTSGTTDPVRLKFNHLMTKINIAPKLDDDYMPDGTFLKVHQLELCGIKTTAIFNILPATIQSGNQTDNSVVEITGQDNDRNISITFDEPEKIYNHRGNVNLFDDDIDPIIMLPQTFTSDSRAKIILTYSINNNGQSKLTLPLKNITWESGKSYIYKLTLDHMGLRIELPAITDWEQADDLEIDAD